MFQVDGSSTTERRGRIGFTLVELLVVIAIIGILVAMLLPAVQAAREAARRAQCQSQMKNVALAMLNYESTKSRFPPAIVSPDPGTASIGNMRQFTSGWSIEILPYLEEQPTFDAFDRTLPIAGGTLSGGDSQSNWANIQARGTEIAVMKCPTDANNVVPYGGGMPIIPPAARGAWGDNWARGNYAANVGPGQMANAGGGITTPPVNTPDEPAWSGGSSATWPTQYWPNTVRGIVGPQEGVRVGQVIDGLSKTMMLAELRSGMFEGDPRGTWALCHAGGNLVAAHGSGGDANGPNYCGPSSDDMPTNAVLGLNTVNSALVEECMTYNQDPFGFAQATSRSSHIGGVFIAYADGSVSFIGDEIETTGAFAACCSVWDHLLMSADEQFTF